MLRVDEIEVGDMIDDPPIELLGHIEIEASVAGFHVVDRNLHPPGHDARDGAVGIPENQNRVRFLFLQHALGADKRVAQHITERRRVHLEEMSGLFDFQVLEEHLVQLVVIVLSGVNEYMVRVCVQSRQYARQPDDLGPCPNYGHCFERRHRRACSDRLGISIGTSRIEDFICPEKRHDVVRPGVGDIVRV